MFVICVATPCTQVDEEVGEGEEYEEGGDDEEGEEGDEEAPGEEYDEQGGDDDEEEEVDGVRLPASLPAQ